MAPQQSGAVVMTKFGWLGIPDCIDVRQTRVRAAHKTALRQLAQLPPHILEDVNAMGLPARKSVEKTTIPIVPPEKPRACNSSRARVALVQPTA